MVFDTKELRQAAQLWSLKYWMMALLCFVELKLLFPEARALVFLGICIVLAVFPKPVQGEQALPDKDTMVLCPKEPSPKEPTPNKSRPRLFSRDGSKKVTKTQEDLEREAMEEAIAGQRIGRNGEDRSRPKRRQGNGAGRKDVVGRRKHVGIDYEN